MSIVIKRSAALAVGKSYYFTGKPCKMGHIAERLCCNGDCVECGKRRSKAFQLSNPCYFEEYASAHKGSAKIAKAKWRAANPEQVKAYNAKWLRANTAKRREYAQNRRARIGGDKLSPGLVEKLFHLQRGRCACCSARLLKSYHLDHIMPLALGGRNVDANMQLLNQRCNNRKHAKHPVAYMQERGFLL